MASVKVLLEEGYRLCMTLNFSITQHMTFAELLSKGKDQEFLVLMAGQLDDKIAAELEAMNIPQPVPMFQVKYMPTEADLEKAFESGAALGRALLAGVAESTTK